jgi:hypothetical protein
MSECAVNWFSRVHPGEEPLAFIWWKNSHDDPKFPAPVPPPFPGFPPPEPWPEPMIRRKVKLPGIPPPEPWAKPGIASSERRG